MSIPTNSDWGFQAIRQHDPNRADRLENAGTPDQLVETLKEELQTACKNDDFRVGAENKFEENRIIIQFKVKPETYDWFYNARTGYRAQFWISVENGISFNHNLVKELRDTFLENIPSSMPARQIKFIEQQEKDVGETILTHQWIEYSLELKLSKVWICERLITPDNWSEEIHLAVLSAAERYLPKLHIPRWKNKYSEGLRAPYPDPEYSWLDVKGAFIRKNGGPYQIKPPEERAKILYKTGWTGPKTEI